MRGTALRPGQAAGQEAGQNAGQDAGRDAPAELAPGAFAYAQHDGSWWVNTSGFVVGDDGVVVVDACATARRTHALIAAIRDTAGDIPVTTVVNTHAHGDHTHGNALFTGAVVVGHERTRAGILAESLLTDTPPFWAPLPDWGGLRARPPQITFADRMDVWAGGTLLELHHLGPRAHTDGDVVAWLPQHGVLYTGDLAFNGVTPLLLSGSVTGYLQVLDRLRAFEARVLVPGHGQPCGPEVLGVLERYSRFVLGLARAGLSAGRSPLECARAADLGEFAALLDPERLVLNLHRAYADLTGTEALDVPAAFRDVLAWLGRPMHCAV